MKLILKYLKKYSRLVITGLLLKFGATIIELLLPYILEYMIDTVAVRGSAAQVLFWGALMLCLALLARAVNVAANRVAIRQAAKSTLDIRRELFSRSLRLSGSQVDGFGLPSLTSRMTADTYNVQNFLRSVQTMGVRAPIMLVGGIILTMTMDVGLSAILCVIAPMMIFVIITISRKGVPLYEKVQRALDDLVCIMRENITGIRVVKSLSKEEYERARFSGKNEVMTASDKKAGIVMALPGPLITLALNVGLTAVVFVGAKRVNSGLTQPGVILAFLTYFNMILMGVMGLNRIFMLFSKASASADRISEVCDCADLLLPLSEQEAPPVQTDAYIRFDHVSFSYANAAEAAGASGVPEDAFAGEDRQNSLIDINFAIKKGGSLGIIGATGSGKTTVINLLMRFYDADSGQIYIGGKDVRTFEADDLRRKFGVVFQNDVIFADTVKGNIVFGRDVDDKAVETAAMCAQVAGFINDYEDTYLHRADIRGANFSGGQKQRILIARALAAAPEILVLDDASSALDYRTDAEIRKAVRANYAPSATIIIAQRVSSVMSLDNILVLDEGRIIGSGTHAQLLATCKQYREICEMQMGGNR